MRSFGSSPDANISSEANDRNGWKADIRRCPIDNALQLALASAIDRRRGRMATNPFELYIVISPIAAAFRGFGGLGSGLGQRRAGDDARVDAMRLALMLSTSLWTTLLGL